MRPYQKSYAACMTLTEHENTVWKTVSYQPSGMHKIGMDRYVVSFARNALSNKVLNAEAVQLYVSLQRA